MDMQYVVMLAGFIITAVGGWIGNHISNKPKRMESNDNRINTIITHLERNWEKCEKRYTKACDENRALRSEKRALKNELDDLKKGGEKLGKSKE